MILSIYSFIVSESPLNPHPRNIYKFYYGSLLRLGFFYDFSHEILQE